MVFPPAGDTQQAHMPLSRAKRVHKTYQLGQAMPLSAYEREPELCDVTIFSITQVFDSDSEEVQREWVKFTQKVDKKMEDALRYTVKRSLQVGGTGFPPNCRAILLLSDAV